MSTFDSFAHDYAERAAAREGASPVVDLLGDVAGLRVLDAGSGPGVHLEAVVARGATAVGIDESARFIEIARERLGDRAELRLGDLDEQLDALEAGSFDRVLLSGVLHHLAQPLATLRRIRRVLAPGGALVVATHHPTADWLQFGGDYFAVTGESQTWEGEGAIPVRRAPLEVLTGEFFAAGFLIANLVEPRGGHGHGHGEEEGRGGPGSIAFVLVPNPVPARA